MDFYCLKNGCYLGIYGNDTAFFVRQEPASSVEKIDIEVTPSMIISSNSER